MSAHGRRPTAPQCSTDRCRCRLPDPTCRLLGTASRCSAALFPSVIVTTTRASVAGVTGRLISSIVLIVPAYGGTFCTPVSVSRHVAGSPAAVALPSTPAVTAAVTVKRRHSLSTSRRSSCSRRCP